MNKERLARFSREGGDIILVSSDKVKFKVHKVNLLVHSETFRDMFQLDVLSGTVTNEEEGDVQIQECELEESSEVLEIVLPYLYPEKAKTGFNIRENAHYNAAIRAFCKYSIWSGIYSATISFVEGLSDCECSYTLVNMYGFALLSENADLKRKAFNAFLALEPSLLELEVHIMIKSRSLPYPDGYEQLKSEWANRTWLMAQHYIKLGNELDTTLGHGSHFPFWCFDKETNKESLISICTGPTDKAWLSLSGIISSKVMKNKVLDIETQCDDCIEYIESHREKLIKVLTNLEERLI